MSVYGQIHTEQLNNCRKIRSLGAKSGDAYINHWALEQYVLKRANIGQFSALLFAANSNALNYFPPNNYQTGAGSCENIVQPAK
jgi:hypothetical protein